MNALETVAVGAFPGTAPEPSRKGRRRLARACLRLRFSANTVVDLAQTTDYFPSAVNLSGGAVGAIVDLLHANTNTQVLLAGLAASGEVPIVIQTSDATTSGSFTDPTSGLPAGSFPIGGKIASGGVFWANSGMFTSGNSSPAQGQINSAPLFASGGIDFASFQRPHRYARLLSLSGNAAILTAGFVAGKKTTGSGGGFTFSPGSGTVNV